MALDVKHNRATCQIASGSQKSKGCRLSCHELDQLPSLGGRTIRSCPPPDKQTEGKEPKLSRLEEARRIIEEYAASLREIIKQLRRKTN
ncbi:hypothetical protein GA0061098_103062 [Bradyrhizobium shewense]|uniref:Uncharacterized protein n=1 Tax=Bradyrhizobium shewense TaxID=1761772 RepID=A0A1C3XS23_9BRAD|nr:hypothetical protein GA0061098_103062 [Bradyrhizobium shewense]